MNRRWFLQILFAIPLLGYSCPALLAANKRVLPETVAELYRAMCEAIPVGESTPIAWAVTGEPYVEYALGAYLPNPRAEAALCAAAWRTFLKVWRESDDPRNAALYWRILPEWAEFDDDWDDGKKSKKCRIYLRYLVSSKPQRYTTEQMLNFPEGTLRHESYPFANGIRMI